MDEHGNGMVFRVVDIEAMGFVGDKWPWLMEALYRAELGGAIEMITLQGIGGTYEHPWYCDNCHTDHGDSSCDAPDFGEWEYFYRISPKGDECPVGREHECKHPCF